MSEPLLVAAFEEKDERALQEFITEEFESEILIFKEFVSTGIQYLCASQDQFTAEKVAQYTQSKLDEPDYIKAFQDVFIDLKLSDVQNEQICDILNQNQDKSIAKINYTEIIDELNREYWRTESIERLIEIGYNASYKEVIREILPKPTVQDGWRMLLLFSSEPSAGKYSAAQVNKEFEVEIEEEANNWQVDDVYEYLQEKGIAVLDCLREMQIQEIFYSPEDLAEVTIKALDAQNKETCYCSNCSRKSENGFIELIFKGFQLNKYVRMTYTIGIITLICQLVRNFQTKVYYELRSINKDVVECFNEISMYYYYINISKTEIAQIVPPLEFACDCPFELALDITSNIIEQESDSQLTNRRCIEPEENQQEILDELMDNQQFAPILPFAFLWRSVSLLKTLKSLYNDFSLEVELLLSITTCQNKLMSELKERKYEDPIAKCPEEISMTCIQISPCPLLESIIALSMNKFLTIVGKGKKLEDFDQLFRNTLINSSYFPFCLQMVWRVQSQYFGNIRHLIEKYQLLDKTIENSRDFEFLLDVLAGFDVESFQKYLVINLLKFGIPFAQALCVCVIRKICTRNLQKCKSFDVSPYSNIFVLPGTEELECNLQTFVAEALREPKSSNFDSELKEIYVSEYDFSEEIMHSCYNTLVSYEQYFEQTVPLDIRQRLQGLISEALELLETPPESRADTSANPEIDQLFLEFSRAGKPDKVYDIITKSKDASFVTKSCKVLVHLLTSPIVSEEDDILSVTYEKMDYYILASKLVGSLLGSVDYLLQLLDILVSVSFSPKQEDKGLGKLILSQILHNIKQKENFTSFADFVVNSPEFPNLEHPDERLYIEIECLGTLRVREITQEYKEACNEREAEFELIQSDNFELLNSSFEDESIREFLVSNRSQMLLSNEKKACELYSQYDKAFQRLQLIITAPKDWRSQIPQDIKALILEDKSQFAEYFTQNFFINCDLAETEPAIYDTYLEMFKYFESPEIFTQIERECALLLFRLVFTQEELSLSEYEFRREKSILLAAWLAKTHMRAEIMDMSGINVRDIDFLTLIKLSKECHTISIISHFWLHFCNESFEMNDFIKPSYGYFKEILEELCGVIKCEHEWSCEACRKISLENFEQGNDFDLLRAYEDIDELISVFYQGEKIIIGQEHDIEIVQKTIIYLPNILLSEENIALLEKATVYQTPLNFTAAFLQYNEELLFQIDCVEIMQREGNIQEMWSKYVENAEKIAANLLDEIGVKQSYDKYSKVFCKISYKIACSFIQNTFLMHFAEEIMSEILERFEFEIWVPEELQELIIDKIIYELALMAAEQVIGFISKEAKTLIELKQTGKANKLEIQLLDAEDEVTATPYEEKSNFVVSDDNDEDIKEKLEVLEKIFFANKKSTEKIVWEQLRVHDNCATWPYTEITQKLLHYWVKMPNNELEQSQLDYSLEAQQLISKQLNIAADKSIQEESSLFLEKQHFSSNLERFAVVKYVKNQTNLIENMANYVQFKSMNYEESIKAFARLCKSILSSENQLAMNSEHSSLISMHNLVPTHPLCVQLHSLRIVLDELWRHNNNEAKNQMDMLLEYAFSAISVSNGTLCQILVGQIKYLVSSKKQNLTTLYSLQYESDFEFDVVNKQIEYQKELRKQFLSIFPTEMKIHDYLKERHFIQSLCTIPSSCEEEISIIETLPFAIYEIIYAVYQDNAQIALDCKNYIIEQFEHVITLSIELELFEETTTKYYEIFDCLYAFFTGCYLFNILTAEEIDKLFKDQFSKVIEQFYQISQPSGVPTLAIQNKCINTLTAVAGSLIYICYSNNDSSLISLERHASINDFSDSVKLIEELYVSSYETLAIIARSSQQETGQNESLFETQVELPSEFENLLLLKQLITSQQEQGQAISPFMEICQIGFDITLSDFYEQGILPKIAECKENCEQFYNYTHEQFKIQEKFSMIDSSLLELFQQFEEFLLVSESNSQLEKFLIEDSISQLFNLGFMSDNIINQQMYDSLLFSVFNLIDEDTKKDIAYFEKKLKLIDDLVILIYYAIEAIPEISVNSNCQQREFQLFLYRMLQFYALISNPEVLPQDKQKFLSCYRNFDLLNEQVSLQKQTTQFIENFFADSSQDQNVKLNEYYAIISGYYIHRLLFSVERHFLNLETEYNRNHRLEFCESFTFALTALSPLCEPLFVSHYVSLISEPVLLEAFLTYNCDFEFEKEINFLKHQLYETEPEFSLYYSLLKPLAYYCYGFYNTEELHVREYVRVFLRLIIIISHDFPEFLQQYRLKISEVLHPEASEVRTYLFASNVEYSPTEEIYGLLSLPQSDFLEILEMEELDDELIKAFKQDYSQKITFIHDVVIKFKEIVANKKNYAEVAPFLHYLALYFVLPHIFRNKIEDNVGFEIIYEILKDLLGLDFGKFVLTQMIVFVANPSTETYVFCEILKALIGQKENLELSQEVLINVKMRATGSYGMQVLNRDIKFK